MTLNTQIKFDALRNQGYVGAQEDMELSFYRDNGATSYSLRDAELEFLVAAGYTTGAVEDRWNAYLLAQEYSGAVDDMVVLSWVDVAVNNLATETGFNLLLEDGSFLLTE